MASDAAYPPRDDVQHVLVIEGQDREGNDLPDLVGPFPNRPSAHDWGKRNVWNGEWLASPMAPPEEPPLVEMVRVSEEVGLYDDDLPMTCDGCGRHLPCRHCPPVSGPYLPGEKG